MFGEKDYPGAVFERVFHLVSCLFGVARELIGASLGAQSRIAGGATEVLLGRPLGGLGLVGDLFTDTHCRLLRFQLMTGRDCGPTESTGGSGFTGVRRHGWCPSVADRARSDPAGEPWCGASAPAAGSPLSQWLRGPAGVRAVGRAPGSETPSRVGTSRVRVGCRARGRRGAAIRPGARSNQASPTRPPRF